MSLPTTYEALIIIALLFVPGFIFVQLIRRAIAHFPEQVDARHFVAILAAGLFLHTVIFPFSTRHIVDWYVGGTLHEHWKLTYVWLVVAVFIWPIAIGIATALVIPKPWVDEQLDRIGLGYIDRIPTAWDYSVLPDKGSLVKVHFRDGSLIGGVYGNKSFASIYSRERDLFLEEIYNMDENSDFVDPTVDNIGIWIAHDVISHVEYFRPAPAMKNEVLGVDNLV
jgi:hypothetical protein